MANEEPTKEFPVYVGQAQVPIPTTAIPYTEPTLQFAPPPPRRNRGLLIVGVLTVMMLLCAGGVLAGIAFFGPGSDTPEARQPDTNQTTTQAPPPVDTQGPRQATERFLAAVLAGNQQGINENLCSLLRSGGQKDNSGGLGLAFIIGYKVGEASVTGPAATVGVELTVPILDPIRFDIYLLQEEGGWRVCGGGPS